MVWSIIHASFQHHVQSLNTTRRYKLFTLPKFESHTRLPSYLGSMFYTHHLLPGHVPIVYVPLQCTVGSRGKKKSNVFWDTCFFYWDGLTSPLCTSMNSTFTGHFLGIAPLVGVHCWFNAFVACFSNDRSGPKLVATLGHGISSE